MPARTRDHFDSPWKSAVKRYLPDFLAFFFQPQWQMIDWSRPCRFLDKELQELFPDGRPHGLLADVLAHIFLLDGRELLLHIEIQSQRDPRLAKRILDYNYCLYKLYDLPVASLVLLADPGARWRPDDFHNSIIGVEMGIHFLVAKVAAYRGLVEELLLERNVFAWVTAAHLLPQQTRGAPLERYAAKWRLVKLLYERGWHKRRIMDLFKVINWLLALPDELERRLWRNIRRLERRHQVEWLTPYERSLMAKRELRGIKKGFALGRLEGREIGIQKGLQKGIEKGMEKGIEKGKREAAERLLQRLLTRRFGPLSATVRKRLAGASSEKLEKWSVAVLDAQYLKEVFGR